MIFTTISSFIGDWELWIDGDHHKVCSSSCYAAWISAWVQFSYHVVWAWGLAPPLLFVVTGSGTLVFLPLPCAQQEKAKGRSARLQTQQVESTSAPLYDHPLPGHLLLRSFGGGWGACEQIAQLRNRLSEALFPTVLLLTIMMIIGVMTSRHPLQNFFLLVCFACYATN